MVGGAYAPPHRWRRSIQVACLPSHTHLEEFSSSTPDAFSPPGLTRVRASRTKILQRPSTVPPEPSKAPGACRGPSKGLQRPRREQDQKPNLQGQGASGASRGLAAFLRGHPGTFRASGRPCRGPAPFSGTKFLRGLQNSPGPRPRTSKPSKGFKNLWASRKPFKPFTGFPPGAGASTSLRYAQNLQRAQMKNVVVD